MLTILLLTAAVAAAAQGPLAPARWSPETEIVLVSLVQGVNPHVALAVARAETGNIPEAGGRRDRVVSQGNYGRFQVNCRAWKESLGLGSCDDLLDRHANIRAGITILAYVQQRRASSLTEPPWWVAHYNEGMLVGAVGERYARRVSYIMRRESRRSRALYGGQRAW
ncbi:MAG TPA: hypothetical protein PLQ97_09105 [Myxococcota bacterium]|nr:hypothetical protein [Myxococcota bacterium]HQK50936.1 hypothetical protein [Myxococcota bacterium]